MIPKSKSPSSHLASFTSALRSDNWNYFIFSSTPSSPDVIQSWAFARSRAEKRRT